MGVGFNLVRRGAEALGSPDEGRLRGLHEPATAGFALVAEGFSPTESAASQRMCGKTMNLTARAAPQKSESHPLQPAMCNLHGMLHPNDRILPSYSPAGDRGPQAPRISFWCVWSALPTTRTKTELLEVEAIQTSLSAVCR
jgi:hypothetical protein